MPTNSTEDKQDFAAKYTARLKTLSKADKAKLKRNVGKTLEQSHNVQAVFWRALPYQESMKPYQQEDYFLVATLYPLADSAQTGSIGKALQLASKNNENKSNGYDRRFQALLNANRDQLPFRLRQIISLLKAADVGVDWAQLMRDIRHWESASRYIQKRWAKDYYYTPDSK